MIENKHTPEPTDIHSPFNACMYRGHCKDLEKQRDELFDVFQLVIAEMEHRDRNDGNAPGHGHDIPGVWDSDNGALAGKPCAWCAVWKKAKELCASIASAKGINPVVKESLTTETAIPAIVFYPAGSLGEEVQS